MKPVIAKAGKKRYRIAAVARADLEFRSALDEIKERGKEHDRTRCRVTRGVYEEEFNWVKRQIPS